MLQPPGSGGITAPACNFAGQAYGEIPAKHRLLGWLPVRSGQRCCVLMTERDLLDRLIHRWNSRQDIHGVESPAGRKAAEMLPILEARKEALK